MPGNPSVDGSKRHRGGAKTIVFGLKAIVFEGDPRIQLILKEHDRFKHDRFQLKYDRF